MIRKSLENWKIVFIFAAVKFNKVKILLIDNGGFLPHEDHCMYIRTKLRNITREDAIQFARDNGIRRPDAIIRDVVASLKQFRTIATK